MRRQSPYPFSFALGALILYLVFIIIPGISGIAYSFTDWNSYHPEVNYVGLDNFKTISNTLIFVLITIVLKTVFALALALLLNNVVKRLTNLYRVMIYLPVVLPTLAVALVFRSILNPATGLLNTLLRGVGLDFLALNWLVDPNIALLSVIGVDTWKGVGYIMVILLAGLQTIPKEYYEAAAVDGAGALAKFRHITWPLLTPALIVVTVLNVLYGLRVFDIVYVLTNGGPGYATEVVSTAIFKAFSQGRYGLGTAISSILFVVMSAVGYFVIRLMEREPAGK
jgi:raffinose/stachyose/melibiose transport system permease protein